MQTKIPAKLMLLCSCICLSLFVSFLSCFFLIFFPVFFSPPIFIIFFLPPSISLTNHPALVFRCYIWGPNHYIATSQSNKQSHNKKKKNKKTKTKRERVRGFTKWGTFRKVGGLLNERGFVVSGVPVYHAVWCGGTNDRSDSCLRPHVTNPFHSKPYPPTLSLPHYNRTLTPLQLYFL